MALEIRNIFRQLSQPSSSQSHPSYSQVSRPIRRALIAGINYGRKPNRLRGAHEDAKAWRKFCIGERYRMLLPSSYSSLTHKIFHREVWLRGLADHNDAR